LDTAMENCFPHIIWASSHYHSHFIFYFCSLDSNCTSLPAVQELMALVSVSSSWDLFLAHPSGQCHQVHQAFTQNNTCSSRTSQ
jgi:hypothetical protein